MISFDQDSKNGEETREHELRFRNAVAFELHHVVAPQHRAVHKKGWGGSHFC